MELTTYTKKQTLWVFGIVYGFAAVIGALVMLYFYNNDMNLVLATLIANISMTVIVFFFSNVTKNASLYDPYWSVIPIIIVLEWMLIYQNFSINVILLFIAVLIWGMRLTLNWWKNWHGFVEQDWRYNHLRDQAPKFYFFTNFFGIHMIPTLVVYLQLINAHDIMAYQGINAVFIIGFILSVTAAVVQYFADKQMYEFRMDHKKEKACIDHGLWKYSRHPNYLGELTFWVGIYFMYFSFVEVINTNLIYPISMIALFLFISIPLMEKKLSNRPGYDEYKAQVSMLLPFRKKNSK